MVTRKRPSRLIPSRALTAESAVINEGDRHPGHPLLLQPDRRQRAERGICRSIGRLDLLLVQALRGDAELADQRTGEHHIVRPGIHQQHALHALAVLALQGQGDRLGRADALGVQDDLAWGVRLGAGGVRSGHRGGRYVGGLFAQDQDAFYPALRRLDDHMVKPFKQHAQMRE